MNAIKSERLAHAYLFCGPRGVGKTTVARILAKAINCENGEPGVPCNTCPSCVGITDGSSVDVQEIDGASNRRIEEVRELREHIKYMPSSSRYRIYIIDEVHMLTKEAFNALLKTLEEPPAHAKFIFATTEIRKVPVTILSRCQRFDFTRISPVDILKHLKKIAEKENVDISDLGLTLITREADGSMRDAQSLFDQVISFCGLNVDDNDLVEILGIIDMETLLNITRGIIEGSARDCLKIIDQVYNYGYDIKEFYRALMNQFRKMQISLINIETDISSMAKAEIEQIRHLSKKAGLEKIQFILNLLINRERDLILTSHPRLFLETLVIKLCHLDKALSFDELIKKIESLEKRLTANLSSKQLVSEIRELEPSAKWSVPDSDSEKGGAPDQKDDGYDKQCGSWDDFLKHLSSRNQSMRTVLKNWQVQKLTDTSVELCAEQGSFSSNYFEDKDRLNQLEIYCRDFFKRDVKPKLIIKKKTESGKKDPQIKNNDNGRNNTEHSPSIQQVIKMFHGEVKPSSNKET
jgi:DNA polymerase-3 subunit gamma/tau